MIRGAVRSFGFVAVLALVSCGPPKITDTGYVGTWARGPKRGRSLIAIVKHGDTYKFRWTLTSDDEQWYVRCDWDGNCEEWNGGAIIAKYKFDCRLDPKSGHLRVTMDRKGTKRSPDSHVDHDELVVEPGGKVLWSYTIQRNDRHYAIGKGPRRSFDKISDAVDDPPPGF